MVDPVRKGFGEEKSRRDKKRYDYEKWRRRVEIYRIRSNELSADFEVRMKEKNSCSLVLTHLLLLSGSNLLP